VAGYRVGMGVIQAKIQTVEDIYRLVRTGVVSKHAIVPPTTPRSVVLPA